MPGADEGFAAAAGQLRRIVADRELDGRRAAFESFTTVGVRITIMGERGVIIIPNLSGAKGRDRCGWVVPEFGFSHRPSAQVPPLRSAQGRDDYGT